MLVLTPKYGSQINLDLLKKQKDKQKEYLIKHRNDIIYLTHCKTIEEAYLIFLDNKGKYFIGYKPKDAFEINVFALSLGEIDLLDVSWIDVSELNSFFNCFINCQVKHIVGLNKWDVSKATEMAWMFFYCQNLESIDISMWDVSNVENMGSMFNSCKKLESIGDISEWDVSNVKCMACMFKECEKLKSIGDLEQWNLHINANTENMFKDSAIKLIPSWYTK